MDVFSFFLGLLAGSAIGVAGSYFYRLYAASKAAATKE